MADLIDRIEEIRTRNNSVWMNLVRLALECEPGRTKELLRQIEEYDSAVTSLLRELAET